MKKLTLILLVVGTSIFFSSCNSTAAFEADVKQSAELGCKMTKLFDRGLKNANATNKQDPTIIADNAAIEKEMAALKIEGKALQDKMDKNYPNFKTDESKKKLTEKIVKEVMAKCNK